MCGGGWSALSRCFAIIFLKSNINLLRTHDMYRKWMSVFFSVMLERFLCSSTKQSINCPVQDSDVTRTSNLTGF